MGRVLYEIGIRKSGRCVRGLQYVSVDDLWYAGMWGVAKNISEEKRGGWMSE